jgi:hypothetical protein
MPRVKKGPPGSTIKPPPVGGPKKPPSGTKTPPLPGGKPGKGKPGAISPVTGLDSTLAQQMAYFQKIMADFKANQLRQLANLGIYYGTQNTAGVQSTKARPIINPWNDKFARRQDENQELAAWKKAGGGKINPWNNQFASGQDELDEVHQYLNQHHINIAVPADTVEHYLTAHPNLPVATAVDNWVKWWNTNHGVKGVDQIVLPKEGPENFRPPPQPKTPANLGGGPNDLGGGPTPKGTPPKQWSWNTKTGNWELVDTTMPPEAPEAPGEFKPPPKPTKWPGGTWSKAAAKADENQELKAFLKAHHETKLKPGQHLPKEGPENWGKPGGNWNKGLWKKANTAFMTMQGKQDENQELKDFLKAHNETHLKPGEHLPVETTPENFMTLQQLIKNPSMLKQFLPGLEKVLRDKNLIKDLGTKGGAGAAPQWSWDDATGKWVPAKMGPGGLQWDTKRIQVGETPGGTWNSPGVANPWNDQFQRKQDEADELKAFLAAHHETALKPGEHLPNEAPETFTPPPQNKLPSHPGDLPNNSWNTNTGTWESVKPVVHTIKPQPIWKTEKTPVWQTQPMGPTEGLFQQDLRTTANKDLGNIKDDFASRGVLHSGLFAQKNADYQTEFEKQLGEINRKKTQSYGDLQAQLLQFEREQQLQISQAKLEAARRAAAQTGSFLP